MSENNLQSVAFPTLNESQIAELARYADATPKKLRAGEALFRCGDRNFKFFVIKSGQAEITDETGEKPRTVTIHGPGSFTGDVNHLTGNPAVVSGIARTDCEVIEESTDELRKV
jgi:thioredoxin reductase (NADPH)